MKTIRARLAVLVATAAIAPLLAYGVVSLQLLRSHLMVRRLLRRTYVTSAFGILKPVRRKNVCLVQERQFMRSLFLLMGARC